LKVTNTRQIGVGKLQNDTKKGIPKPTDAELEILQVLWQRGPSTVREVHEDLNPSRQTGYTTVLKLMQIMTEKGLVRRDERQRAHVYHAGLPQDLTQRQLIGDLLDKAFEGSAAKLVMQALATKRASSDDLSEIRKLLDEYEEKGRR
jgi:predicted transcriptional regulator